MRIRLTAAAVLVGLLGVLVACSDARRPARSVESSETASTPPTPASSGASPTTASKGAMPCNPGGGFPKARAGCPDPEPETGRLDVAPDGRRTLRPFRTFGNDAAGEAYAKRHGLKYPFANDHFDAPDGSAYEVRLDPTTICTGIIMVGYSEPLKDHVVPCSTLDEVAFQQKVPVALWRTESASCRSPSSTAPDDRRNSLRTASR